MLHWMEYRVKELEEKADVVECPVYDMDGTRFVGDETAGMMLAEEDAYYASMSKRLDAVSMAPSYNDYDYSERFPRRESSDYDQAEWLNIRMVELDRIGDAWTTNNKHVWDNRDEFASKGEWFSSERYARWAFSDGYEDPWDAEAACADYDCETCGRCNDQYLAEVVV